MRTLLMTGAFLLSSAVASAQSADPEALLREGVVLRRAHRDAEALTRFEAAWRGSHSPRALAQVGLAEQAVGRWIEAETHVREALASADDSWIASNAPALRAALAVIGQHPGNLWIEGPLDGEVLVDGQRIARLPMSTAARLIAGSVVIEVRAPGYESVRRPLVVPAGGEAREVVRMASSSTTARVTPPPESPAQPSARGEPARPATAQRPLAWVALAGAVAGTGIGIGTLVAREGTVADYNGDRDCPGVRSATQPGECQSRIDGASTLGLVGAVALAAGGALAVGSIVLFATSPSRERAAERSGRVACGVTLGAWGASCAGRF